LNFGRTDIGENKIIIYNNIDKRKNNNNNYIKDNIIHASTIEIDELYNVWTLIFTIEIRQDFVCYSDYSNQPTKSKRPL